jgi:glutamate racemase
LNAIGIFDSGMGGLTVMRALKARLPNESFRLSGRHRRLPYGTKSADTVTRYAVQASRLLMKHDIKLLVVACNTASAAALPTLTQTLAPLPVVGVIEPGAEAAVATVPDGPIAVIATEGTVKGGAYVRAIQQRSPRMPVVQQACPLFVALAEEGLRDGPITELAAHRYLDPLARHISASARAGVGMYPFSGAEADHCQGRRPRHCADRQRRDHRRGGGENPERKVAAERRRGQGATIPGHRRAGPLRHLGEIFLGEPIDPGSVTLVDL